MFIQLDERLPDGQPDGEAMLSGYSLTHTRFCIKSCPLYLGNGSVGKNIGPNFRASTPHLGAKKWLFLLLLLLSTKIGLFSAK